MYRKDHNKILSCARKTKHLPLYLIVVMLVLFFNACSNKNQALTKAEKQWIKNNASDIVIPFGYLAAPNAYYNEDGEYVGLLVDFEREIENKLKTNFRHKNFTTWNEITQYARLNRNYIIVGIARTPEREKYLNFTNSFVKIPYVIIARHDSEIGSMGDLRAKSVCITRGYAVTEYLDSHYEYLNYTEVDDNLEGLRAVASGVYDAMITNQAYATYLMEQEGFSNLKIAGESGYINRLAAAVSKQDQELYQIVDKAVDQISDVRRKALYRKWIFQNNTALSVKIAYVILAISLSTLLIVVVLWFFLKRLRQQVQSSSQVIRRGEKRYKSLIENSSDAIYILHDKKLVSYNKKFVELFGYSEEELNSDDFQIIKLVADESLEFIKERSRKIANNEPVSTKYEYAGKTKNNDKLYLEVYVRSERINNYLETQGTIHDITDRKRREEELIKAKEKAEESDKLKSAFLANMSHEIRTPMNGILGFTQLLKDNSQLPKELQHFIDIIQKSGNRMLSTINNIIDVSKIESGVEILHITEVDIYMLLSELNEFFLPEAENKKLKFVFEQAHSKDRIKILTDEYKLNSILTNLIKNAIKFTQEGEIKFGYTVKEEAVEFFVHDTGMGIPLEKQETVFNHFEQADHTFARGFEGSGLGLSITKGYINLLNGTIKLESSPGAGSKFWFSIPTRFVTPQILQEKEALSKSLNISPDKDLKILIVEDDKTSADYLFAIISGITKKIIITNNGVSAIKTLRKHPDIDVIFMDIRMPGMNGLEATQEIRKFNKDVFIIAQTAYTHDNYKENTLEVGCNACLYKPINRKELQNILSNKMSTAKA